MRLGLGFETACSDAGRTTSTAQTRPHPLLHANSPAAKTMLGAPFVPRPVQNITDVPSATTPSCPRQTQSHFVSFATPAITSCDPRTFIDITPEKLARSGSGQKESGMMTGGQKQKERVKKLISRASNGFAGWGRSLSLTRKGGKERESTSNGLREKVNSIRTSGRQRSVG